MPLLYIGEADDVRHRVDGHVKSKDFWTHAVAFRQGRQPQQGTAACEPCSGTPGPGLRR